MGVAPPVKPGPTKGYMLVAPPVWGKPSSNSNETKPIEDEKINERKMTKAEMKERERIVRRLKDKMAGFEKRYGKRRAKDVLYATATKMAMEELKGDQHEIDANKNGRIDADDFRKLRGEKSVDEGEDKKENKSKKNRFLRKLGYKDSPVDFTSPGNTAAMAVRAGRDKLKKEEPTNPAAQDARRELMARIAAHQAANQAAKPQPVRKPAAALAPKSGRGPSIYDAAKNLPPNPAAEFYKKEIAARQQTKKK